ncbi:MAG: nucleoside recognition domain-containing protein [Clostridia bacterium]|nr:nucleoside recognition domain-containing protein [Clostridia bacterium]
MSTRIIKDSKERDLSIMLTPFIPCSAKLPIIAMFTGYFFTDKSGLVSASLYFFAIAIILISAIIIKKIFMKNSGTAFISELPEYKLPSIKYVTKDVFDKITEFIKRAGTIILFCSVIIWFLLSFSWKLEYGIEIKNSILASIGNSISWVFYPILGTYSWEATVSAIQGLVAKEQVISSMSIIAGLSEGVEQTTMLFQSTSFRFFNSASAYAFMVFNLFSAPCFGAIGAMRREFGSTKKMLKAILFQTALAWILASIVFNIGIL